MKSFFSISQHPSGLGETVYRTLFHKFNVRASYTSLGATDLGLSLRMMASGNVDGFSVSMPFKEKILHYLRVKDVVVKEFGCCNTVTVHRGELHGFNTDFYAVANTIASIPLDEPVSILGNGCMGKMFKHILGNRATVYSRSLGNWELRYRSTGTVINCTALGTSSPDSPFAMLPPLNRIIDLAIKENNLEKQALANGVEYTPGIEFYQKQITRQFYIYTGIRITDDDTREIFKNILY